MPALSWLWKKTKANQEVALAAGAVGFVGGPLIPAVAGTAVGIAAAADACYYSGKAVGWICKALHRAHQRGAPLREARALAREGRALKKRQEALRQKKDRELAELEANRPSKAELLAMLNAEFEEEVTFLNACQWDDVKKGLAFAELQADYDAAVAQIRQMR